MRINLKDNYLEYINEENFELSLEIHKSKINHIVKELSLNTNSNYLISGYRGVGKSTFIKLLDKGLKKNNDEKIEKLIPGITNEGISLSLLINVNLGSYSNYTNLLRKLIRSIYLEIDNLIKNSNPILEKQINDGANILLEEMKLLYDKTFFDIQNNGNSIDKIEKISIFNTDINFKILTVAALPFFTTLISWIYDLSDYISNHPIISLIISAVWAALVGCGLTLKYEKTNIKNEELVRNSLYDDEIADYKLNELIRKLKDQKFFITFVFDEIDKMNEKQVVNFFNEVKPLMLSNNANFLFVTGQQVYYEYEFAQTLDDPLITSLFSKTLHVELASKKFFEKIFNQMVNFETTEVTSIVIGNYLDYKILESDRILRKFINLIRHDIEYNEIGKPFINLRNYKIGNLSNNARILRVIEAIEKDFFEKEIFSDAIKDFFDMQLYLAVKKAKKFFEKDFQSIDLINVTEYENDKNLFTLIFEVQSLVEVLLEELSSKGILEKKQQLDSEGLNQNFYRWKENENVELSHNKNGFQLEDDINRVFKAYLSGNELNEVLNREVEEKLLKLNELNLIDSNKYRALTRNYINYQTNKNNDNHKEYLSKLLKSQTSYMFFIYEIYQNILFELLKGVLDFNHYNIYKESNYNLNKYVGSNRYDMILEKESNKKKIIFEIKVFRNKNSVKSFLRKFNTNEKRIFESLFDDDSIISIEVIIFGDFEEQEIVNYQKEVEYQINERLVFFTFVPLNNLDNLKKSIREILIKIDEV